MRGDGARPADIEALYRERSRAFLVAATALLGDGEAALDVDNVYLRTEGLPDEPVGGFVAFDANGARIYELCFVAAAFKRD